MPTRLPKTPKLFAAEDYVPLMQFYCKNSLRGRLTLQEIFLWEILLYKKPKFKLEVIYEIHIKPGHIDHFANDIIIMS